MLHSFLLVGQSNMAGRGDPREVEPIRNPHLFVLRNGRWQPMFVPVNPDRPFSGINLAESFADAYQKAHQVDVGLIPCADGGTTLAQWRPGGLLYDHAVYQSRLVDRTSTIAGVLWHQGEGDCAPDRYPHYEEKLAEIIAAFRRDLGLEDVPFLCGGLGDFLADCPLDPDLSHYREVNRALLRLAETLPMTGYVPAEQLRSNPDHLHFSAAALREFGLRYYHQFCRLERTDKVFLEKNGMDLAVRSPMESL